MGHQKEQPYALVSMTNKDVYYIDKSDVAFIFRVLEERDHPEFMTVTDAKSGARVLVQVANISSVVIQGGRDE